MISGSIVQAPRGEPVTVYGDGQQTRSICYVDDLVEADILFMEPGGKITTLEFK